MSLEPWKNRVERLRKYVTWECKDIPPDLVLAIINNESSGQIGIKGRVKTRSAYIPTQSGDMKQANYAFGLMQVIPSTINWYNQDVEGNDIATYEDMIGNDERSARIQIRVGCKYLAFVNNYLHKKFSEELPSKSLSEANDSQIALVATGYAVGHGATKKKLQTLKDKGLGLTFSNVKKEFPNWGKNRNGKWINRPLFYASKIIKNYNKHKGNSFDTNGVIELSKRIVGDVSKGKKAIAALIFFGGAAYLINRHFTKSKGIM
jgi:hypothetical protein